VQQVDLPASVAGPAAVPITALLIAMGIGAFLPPLGMGFYIACAIARAPMGASTRAMVPYVAVVLLVTFVPWFTLSLPRAIGLIP
jgi:TRAP-type C4-dicarboxylate transport system permease large subunit